MSSDEISSGMGLSPFSQRCLDMFTVFIACVIMYWFGFYKQNYNFIKLDLFISHSGKDLCSECKQKAGFHGGFTEVQEYTLFVKAENSPCIRFVNTFNDSDLKKQAHMLFNEKRTVCIHDCGGLQCIGFEMFSEKPIHLLCSPNEDYGNIIVVEKVNYQVDLNEEYENVDSGAPKLQEPSSLESKTKFYDPHIADYCPVFYSSGSIILSDISCFTTLIKF